MQSADFYIKEREGREYLEQVFPRFEFDFSIIEDNDTWDVSGMTKTGKGFIGEIKLRDTRTTSFSTALLELDKYQSLIQLANENNVDAVYYNFHTDNKLLIYNLSQLPIETFKHGKKMLPVTTSEDRGYKLKDVIYLPISAATKSMTYNKK